MDKKSLSEQDIRTKFITPAITQVGWDPMTQLREEVYFTKGRIIVRGKKVSRGKKKFADYVLYHRSNVPIAVVEAKDNNHMSIEDSSVLRVTPFDQFGTPVEIVRLFGDRNGFANAVRELEDLIYARSPVA